MRRLESQARTAFAHEPNLRIETKFHHRFAAQRQCDMIRRGYGVARFVQVPWNRNGEFSVGHEVERANRRDGTLGWRNAARSLIFFAGIEVFSPTLSRMYSFLTKTKSITAIGAAKMTAMVPNA